MYPILIIIFATLIVLGVFKFRTKVSNSTNGLAVNKNIQPSAVLSSIGLAVTYYFVILICFGLGLHLINATLLNNTNKNWSGFATFLYIGPLLSVIALFVFIAILSSTNKKSNFVIGIFTITAVLFFILGCLGWG